jgi:hypothetical protein
LTHGADPRIGVGPVQHGSPRRRSTASRRSLLRPFEAHPVLVAQRGRRRHAAQCRCQQQQYRILRVAHSVVTPNGTIGVTTLVGGAIQSTAITTSTEHEQQHERSDPAPHALAPSAPEGSPALRPTRRPRPCSRRLVPGWRPSCNATVPGMPLSLSVVISETWHKSSAAAENSTSNLVLAGFKTFFGH